MNNRLLGRENLSVHKIKHKILSVKNSHETNVNSLAACHMLIIIQLLIPQVLHDHLITQPNIIAEL